MNKDRDYAFAKDVDDNLDADFKFSLYSDLDSNEPEILVSIPDHFGSIIGVISETYTVSLPELLDTFITDHIAYDHGASSHKVSDMLRQYADAIDREVAEFNAANPYA